MTRLRQQMLDELERRNYSASTVRAYIRTVEDLARYFKRRPDQLEPEHIRQYQAHLFRDRKLAANTVAQRVAALRFFYIRTLGQEWNLMRSRYERSLTADASRGSMGGDEVGSGVRLGPQGGVP